MHKLYQMTKVRTPRKSVSANQRLQRGFARLLVRALLRKNSAFWLLILVAILYIFMLPKYSTIYPNVKTKDAVKTVAKNSQSNKVVDKEEDGLAACLLIMDDNHFLVEWLAYHYHAANLRKIVVAVDPKSTTSPLEILGRWKENIDITVWTSDDDYATKKDFGKMKAIVSQTFTEKTPSLVDHRARQRLFYTSCLRTIKKDSEQTPQKSAWTMMVDVDEFVRVNYRISGNETSIPPIEQPGSVTSVLNLLSLPEDSPSSSEPKWKELRSSPCVPLPRVRFASNTENDSSKNQSPSFLTQSYNGHAKFNDQKRNKITKAIIDLSRVPYEDIATVDSIHMPIRTFCSRRNRYFSPNDSLLIVNHYTGSYEQFTYRDNDARNEIVADGENTKTKVNVRNAEHFKEQQKFGYPPQTDDEIQPWLGGFHQEHQGLSNDLLKDSGLLSPKSWRTIEKRTGDEDRCALLFFGLPRSYGEMVLPSLVENVLKPNARHGCDVYVHYYRQESEEAGRRNEGGKLNPDDVLLLKDAVRSVSTDYFNKEQTGKSGPSYQPPTVLFAHDTPEDFTKRYSTLLEKYQTATTTYNGTTVEKYFPWLARTYVKSSVDNMVKQWHSIQSAFKLMDYTAKQRNFNYTRVGMFRSDCLYVTPIDIASLGTKTESSISSYDTNNEHFVVPNFALYPINDRLVYGPYEAIKVWATQRFNLMEERAEAQVHPGKIFHSEYFLAETVFPAMEKLGYDQIPNSDVCFLRARAGGAALLNDCSAETKLTNTLWAAKQTPKIEQERLSVVEAVVGTSCTLRMTDSKPKVRVASCTKQK